MGYLETINLRQFGSAGFFLSGAENRVDNCLHPEMEFHGSGKILQHLLPGESVLDLIQPGVEFFSGCYGAQHAVVKFFQKFTVGLVSHVKFLALHEFQAQDAKAYSIGGFGTQESISLSTA
jgi:hypothetical protein